MNVLTWAGIVGGDLVFDTANILVCAAAPGPPIVIDGTDCNSGDDVELAVPHFWDGKLLIRGGAIAMSDACCCSPSPSPSGSQSPSPSSSSSASPSPSPSSSPSPSPSPSASPIHHHSPTPHAAENLEGWPLLFDTSKPTDTDRLIANISGFYIELDTDENGWSYDGEIGDSHFKISLSKQDDEAPHGHSQWTIAVTKTVGESSETNKTSVWISDDSTDDIDFICCGTAITIIR